MKRKATTKRGRLRLGRLAKARRHQDPKLGGRLSDHAFIHTNKEGYMNHHEWKELFLDTQLPHALRNASKKQRMSFVIDDSTDIHEPKIEGYANVAEYKRATYNTIEGKVPKGLTPLRPNDHPLINGTWKIGQLQTNQ